MSKNRGQDQSTEHMSDQSSEQIDVGGTPDTVSEVKRRFLGRVTPKLRLEE